MWGGCGKRRWLKGGARANKILLGKRKEKNEQRWKKKANAKKNTCYCKFRGALGGKHRNQGETERESFDQGGKFNHNQFVTAMGGKRPEMAGGVVGKRGGVRGGGGKKKGVHILPCQLFRKKLLV